MFRYIYFKNIYKNNYIEVKTIFFCDENDKKLNKNIYKQKVKKKAMVRPRPSIYQ